MNDWQNLPFVGVLKEPVRNGIYKPKQFHGRGSKIVNMGELFGYPRLHAVPMKRVELTQSELQRFTLSEGDLLFARRSLVAEGAGKCCIVLELSDTTTFESSIIRARPDPAKALPLFLYYFFSSPVGFHRLDTIRRQVAVSGITGGDLSQLRIPIPPLGDQHKIASTLNALDAKIELNQKMNETLQLVARAIFKDWFVDFGPTRAKMSGTKPYLAPEIWNLFPARLDDEGKPEGWNSGRLDDLLVLQRGFDLPIQDRTPGKFAVMAASGINGTHNEAMVRGPGVTTGRSGVLGQTFFVHEDFWPLNTSLWVKEFKASSPAHGYFLIRTLDFRSFNTGSAVPTLNRNHVHNLSQIIPDTALVSAFDEIALPLLKYQRANEKEAETLAATRELLLPKLMSGEVRVTEVTKMVEAELELHL